MVRLQKYLADCGIASRRKCEDLISEGRICVNGIVITELGTKVSEDDIVLLDGKIVQAVDENIYIMLHKPEKYVTTVFDQFGRPTVMDLIKDKSHRLFPVGRLDYDTSGLLILSNDGELTYRLTHPKHRIKKTYIARLAGEPTKDKMERFKNGLRIENYITSPADIEIISSNNKYCSAKIVLYEGKNRQVRKMCTAIGHEVLALKRIATGELELGNLKPGKYRKLSPNEIAYLKGLTE